MPTDAKGIGYTPVALIDPTTGLPASTSGGGGGGGAANPYPGSDYATSAKQDTGNAALGTTTDAATGSGTSTTVVGALRAIRDRLLGTLQVQLAAMLPSGTNTIGKVSIDQTTQGVTNAVTVIGAPVGSTPNGYQQITTVNAGQVLTAPTGSLVATVVPDGAGVRMRKDGTAPTATVGMPIPVGAYVKLYGVEIAAAQFTQVAAGAILNVEYGK